MKCGHYREPRKSAPVDTVSLRQGCCSIVNLNQEDDILVSMKLDMRHNHKPEQQDGLYVIGIRSVGDSQLNVCHLNYL